MDKERHGHEKSIGTREWYDFVALVAEFTPDIHPGGQEATLSLLDMLRLEASHHVLDVGCGPGTTARLIAGEAGSQVTGIDISEAMLAAARERAEREGLGERVRLQVGDALDLTFDDATFDAVIFESLLTVIRGDPEDALAEMVRVVRPRGRIGGNEATVDRSVPPDVKSLLAQHPAIYRTFTPEGLQQQFEEARLEELEVTSVPPGEAPSLDVSGALQEMGMGRMLSFFVRSYPRLLGKLLFDPRFRRAHRIDEQVTKLSEEYMGYAMIVGRKPS